MDGFAPNINCDICGPDDLSGERHHGCEAEWNWRANNKKCTKCGINDATNDYWCGECTPESPFLGYPPTFVTQPGRPEA